jgi:YD repeat-containing protein
VHVLWLAIPLYFYARLLRSEAYAFSIERAKSSSEVQRVLGTGVHTRWLPIGSALRSYGSDFAEWSVVLAGSHGSGRLYGIANKIGTDWEISRLTLVPANGGPSLNLTPPPPRLHLPPAKATKAYLVPLDPTPQQSLSWATDYYKAKLGISVDLLPAVTLAPSAEDPTRHQLIAEKCIDAIAQAYPELANDPSVVLVGVTSRDMFIQAFNWSYAENYREYGRMAVVSSARFEPTDFPGKWNKELLNSRLQKMITKNIVMLCFDLPLSSDYTSLLSSGILSGREVDYMSSKIVGASGQWDPSFNAGDAAVTITASPDKPMTWRFDDVRNLPDRSAEIVNVYIDDGLLIQRKMDFYLDGEYPLELMRVYSTSTGGQRSWSFGVNAQHSLDTFLVGEMEKWVDLNFADGSKVHFDYVKPQQPQSVEIYRAVPNYSKEFSNAEARYESDTWRVTTGTGWTYLFPYRPKARGSQVTVLTGFYDPSGHKTEMTRNEAGDLLEVTTPSGKWLRFECDSEHRVRRITDSQGRTAQYEYDQAGRLTRVTDIQGHSETYAYNTSDKMISIMDGSGNHVLSNEFTETGLIASQTLNDGRRLQYGYQFAARNVIRQSFLTDSSGLMTDFSYGPGGYVQSLPFIPGR